MKKQLLAGYLVVILLLAIVVADMLVK